MLRSSRPWDCVCRHISPERYHLTRAGRLVKGQALLLMPVKCTFLDQESLGAGTSARPNPGQFEGSLLVPSGTDASSPRFHPDAVTPEASA